jgi:hypothetical protein
MGVFDILFQKQFDSPAGKQFKSMVDGTNKNKYLSMLTDDDELHFYKRYKESLSSFIIDILDNYIYQNTNNVRIQTFYFFVENHPFPTMSDRSILIRICDKKLEKIIVVYNIPKKIGCFVHLKKDEEYEIDSELHGVTEIDISEILKGTLEKSTIDIITKYDIFFPANGNIE